MSLSVCLYCFIKRSICHAYCPVGLSPSAIKVISCSPYNIPVEYPLQVEPETLAVIKWMQNYNFVLSANLHGGAVVANYPFDRSRDPRIRGRTTYAATADDKIFRKVCCRLKISSRCYAHLISSLFGVSVCEYVCVKTCE